MECEDRVKFLFNNDGRLTDESSNIKEHTMEDDIDIYEDLPSFETKDCKANKELMEECSKLREENTKLKEDVMNLGANVSSLMKTAKAEIARKDRMITQLRQELDNAAFRRGNYGVRRKQNTYNPIVQKWEQNTEKTQQTPLVKEEALQENVATELEEISDVEDTEDMEHRAQTDLQVKLTSTVFGARLKNKLLLEQEAERIKKEEARIASLAIPIKAEKVVDTELESLNGFVKQEDSKDMSQDTSTAPMEKIEVPVVSSLPHSTACVPPLHQADNNLCHRQALKRNLLEQQDFTVYSEQPKRRRVEEERYSRDEDARRHHSRNFKYDDVRYNSDGFENNDYSKTSTKYIHRRRNGHKRDDYDRAHYKVRDGRLKSIYRPNGVDPRHNGRRPDRYTMEESRARNDKYEKRREDGWSREGDDKWSEYSRQINEIRDKIDGKIGGGSEYDKHNGHHQVEWNLKRLGCTSRSPERYRSHSGSRGSREKEFDKRQSKRSRSTDQFTNAKSTVDEREFSKERQSDTENTESAKVTLEKLVSQEETPNVRIAAFENNSEVSAIQSAIPEPAMFGSGSLRKEKRREDGWSRDGDDNWSEYSKQIAELRDKIEGKVDDRSEYHNYNSHHQSDRSLKRLGRKSRSPEKDRSRSDSRKSREKEFDKRRSKRSTSTDQFMNVKSTVDERESGKERQSTRVKDSEDNEVELKNTRDTQPEVPSDFPRNNPSKEVAIDKISSSEIAENGSVHADIENAESAGLILEKLPSQVETPDGQIAALENDSETAPVQSAMPEPAALESGSSGEEKRQEADNNCIEYRKENDELRDKFESNVVSSSDCNNYTSLTRLGDKSRLPEKHRSNSDCRKSIEKKKEKRSRSADKCINAKSTVVEQESGKKRQSTRAKDSKDIEVEVKNSCDAQPEVHPVFPPKEVAIDKISSSEIVANGLDQVEIENMKSARVILEKLVSQVENDSEAASIQSAIPESASSGSGSSREEKRREGGNNCIEYGKQNDELRDKFESNVGSSSDCNNYTSFKRLGDKSRLPEKYRSHSDTTRSTEKKKEKRSISTVKCINAKSTVDERESDKKRQSTRAKDSKDIEVEVKNSRNGQQEVPPVSSRNDSPKEVAIDKISSSEIVGSSSGHFDIENAKSARVILEKLVSRVEKDSEAASLQSAMPEPAALGSGLSREEKRREGDNNCIEYGKENVELRDKFESNIGGSSECDNDNSLKKPGDKSRMSEKSRSHSDRRRSKEKELDKRRSKRSRSSDKSIKGKSMVDERESGKKRQSTRAKDSKDIEVELKNSCDVQPEVPPDLSSNDPPKEVAIDKISSSEIAENGLPLSTEEPGHGDIENTESARVSPEKIGRIAALDNDSEVSSIQASIPEVAILGSGLSGEEKQPEGDSNCIEYSREIDEQRAKFESDVDGKSRYNNNNSHHQSDRSLKRLGRKSCSPEKDRSRSDSRKSREKELDKRRSKRSARSTSTDKLINVKSTVDGRESGKELQSTRAKDSKDFEVDVKNSRNDQPEVPLDFSKNSPPNEAAINKISSSDIANDASPQRTAGPDHVDIENAESMRVTVEKIVGQVETANRWIADLENDSEVVSVQSAIQEPAAAGSASFREEKIENIERFIQDYQENDEPCLPIANRESEEREKLGDSTSSIVDTLSMDIEESAADAKSDNVTINPPEESRSNIKDVAGDTESTIPKSDTPAGKCTSSAQLKTVEDKEISVVPEISDKKADREKLLTDKVAVLKLTKCRPRIPCAAVPLKSSRRKQMVWSDSVAISEVKSQSSMNTDGDNELTKEIKTRRIPMEEPSVQSNDSSAKKLYSTILISKKEIDDKNILTGKSSNATAPETKNITDDSCTRDEVDCRVENSENNFVSVSSSGRNILHQAKSNPELPVKADAAPKLNIMQEPVELRETRLAQKTTPAAVPSTDSKLSNRKKALPKEVDGRAKLSAKQCNIVVTARQRRPFQPKDSCVAITLVPSGPDVNCNGSVKTVCAKAEAPELPKLDSQPVIRARKRRWIDK